MTILDTRFRPPYIPFIISSVFTLILFFFIIKIVIEKAIVIELISLLCVLLLIGINIFFRSGRLLIFFKRTGLKITEKEIFYSEPGYISVKTIRINRKDIIRTETSGESILISHKNGDLILRMRNFEAATDQILLALQPNKS